jgi:putative transposase
VESFHGRFRDECLNREQLWTLTEARVVVGDFRQEYNQIRPHSRLGYASPTEFAKRICSSPDGQEEKKTTTSNQPLD